MADQKSFSIVFDFGGVLIDWNPRYLYRRFFDGDGAAIDRFLDEIGFMQWNLRQDAGRPFAAAVEELSARFPHYRDLIRAYDERYEESISGPIEPAVEILRALKLARYPLYALSNWSSEKFRLIRPRMPFMEWFDGIVISGEVGLVKPDPRIYALLLDRIGRPPAECVMVDDSDANTAAAAVLGFQAIRYESPAQLRADLAQLGIDLAQD